MSAIKERIFGAITVMSEEDAPTDEEIKIITAYKNGEKEYQPFITHEELIKELGVI